MKEKQAEQEAAEAKAAEQETAEAAEAEKAEDAKNAEEAAEPEVDPKDAKIEELQNRLLRLQADFENFRRRTNIEKEQLSTFVTANVVGKFLKVLDNFERAEASVEKGDNVDAVVDGMKKIRRQFEDAFKDLKVEEIEAQNAKFDPNIHEAVMRGHNPELDDEIVDMVFEKGYKLGDKVIRHNNIRNVKSVSGRNTATRKAKNAPSKTEGRYQHRNPQGCGATPTSSIQ